MPISTPRSERGLVVIGPDQDLGADGHAPALEDDARKSRHVHELQPGPDHCGREREQRDEGSARQKVRPACPVLEALWLRWRFVESDAELAPIEDLWRPTAAFTVAPRAPPR
jgi:hypothetical protein